ncbi:MAG: MBL fold metallo-hydrolase [Desulfobacterota bacterium]|nr:MBL fold metallo-hydrolase [Thermodesulfobacteriota bacterium]
MKIIEHVYQVGGSGISAPGDAAIYLITSGDIAALIDAGTGEGHENVVKAIDACRAPGTPVSFLFLTHCHYDHCGGAARLKKHYECDIIAHEMDARFLETGDGRVTAALWYNADLPPLTVDYKISTPQEYFLIGNLELQAIHCPGHSPGSLVYLLETPGHRVLFGQDIHGPLHPDLLSNRDDYIVSLSMLLKLNADILCEGHFGIIRGKDEVHKFIQSYIP